MGNDATAVLNELIETSKDGQKGFQKAAEDTSSEELRAMFTRGAQRCAEGARELETLVRQLGGGADGSGSLIGTLHRGWLSIREAISSRDNMAILDEVERGEDYAKNAYRKALEANLPSNVRFVVQRQYEGVIANHDAVRAARERIQTVKT